MFCCVTIYSVPADNPSRGNNFRHFQISKLNLGKRSLHLTESTDDFETYFIVLVIAVRHV